MTNKTVFSTGLLFTALLFTTASVAEPPGSPWGPGNSGAAQNQLPDPQKNCVGAWVSTAAGANQGLDVLENNEPGEVVSGISELFQLGNAIGLYPLPEFGIFYPTCEEYAPIP